MSEVTLAVVIIALAVAAVYFITKRRAEKSGAKPSTDKDNISAS